MTKRRNVWALLRALRHHHRECAALRYRFLNRVPGMSGPQAALAYVLRHSRISMAIFSTTQTAHLEENAAAARMTFPPALVARIERLSEA